MDTKVTTHTNNNSIGSSTTTLSQPQRTMLADMKHESSLSLFPKLRYNQLLSTTCGGRGRTVEGGTTPEERDNGHIMLTKSSVPRIYDMKVNEHNTEEFQPIVQVIHIIKNIHSYQLYVSDGVDCYKVHLDVPSNEHQVETNSIIRLLRFKHLSRFYEEDKHICIFECEFLQQINHRIGKPVGILEDIIPLTDHSVTRIYQSERDIPTQCDSMILQLTEVREPSLGFAGVDLSDGCTTIKGWIKQPDCNLAYQHCLVRVKAYTVETGCITGEAFVNLDAFEVIGQGTGLVGNPIKI